MLLAEKIRAIEQRHGEPNVRSTTFGAAQHGVTATGWSDIDAALGGGLFTGGLHEWLGVTHALAGRLPPEMWGPPVCVPVHLAWQVVEASPCSFWAVWIGKRCFPYPSVLVREEGNDRRLLERSIFVAAVDPASRLWAVDVALRSPVVGVVVADGSQFNMAASRRVQLVAKAHGTLALLVRPPGEQTELSAAQSRWLVQWEPSRGSEASLQANPRWSVKLLRCKGVQPGRAHGVWALEWHRATSTLGLSTPVVDQPGKAQQAGTARCSRSA